MAKARIETDATPGAAGQDIAWLRALEEKVHAAAGRIRDLKEENAGLRRTIEELEAQLESSAAAPGEDAARWAEEREEIRGRVERLVEHLEGLEDL